jgi:hypothetical protein
VVLPEGRQDYRRVNCTRLLLTALRAPTESDVFGLLVGKNMTV